jgi:hypothetical protein
MSVSLPMRWTLKRATLEQAIAALHARAHEEASSKGAALSIDVAGALSPARLHHPANRHELVVLVMNAGSYAMSVTADSASVVEEAPPRALDPGTLKEIVSSVTSAFTQHTPSEPRVSLLRALDSRALREILSSVAAALAEEESSGLTEAERRLLARGGVELERGRSDALDAAARAALDYQAILADAYTVEHVAKLLGVATSRIRQRLTARPATLLGIKVGREWRIPKFQFRGRRMMVGIDRVVERLPGDLSTVAVYRWFTSPNPDLEIEGAPVTPLQWLESGEDPRRPAELAAGL